VVGDRRSGIGPTANADGEANRAVQAHPEAQLPTHADLRTPTGVCAEADLRPADCCGPTVGVLPTGHRSPAFGVLPTGVRVPLRLSVFSELPEFLLPVDRIRSRTHDVIVRPVSPSSLA